MAGPTAYKQDFANLSTWVVTHNLGTPYVNIDVIVDNNGVLETILPKNITSQDDNTTVVTFSNPMTGFVRVKG